MNEWTINKWIAYLRTLNSGNGPLWGKCLHKISIKVVISDFVYSL